MRENFKHARSNAVINVVSILYCLQHELLLPSLIRDGKIHMESQHLQFRREAALG